MTTTEIIDQIAKLEKGLNNPNIPASAKATLKTKIDGLKSQLAEAQKTEEKKEEKTDKQEEKVHSELETTIAKLEKGLSNPNIPASAKEGIKKKIATAKDELAKHKKELEASKKEAAKEKKEVKKAIKKAPKAPRKGGGQKRVPKKIEKREKKSKMRKKKLNSMLSELDKLIQKNKELRGKYKGKGVDLDRDSKRSAKPFGYRFTGKHNYRVPKKSEIKAGLKRGTIDYEGRPNRADRFPKGVRKSETHPKLAQGGRIEKADMVGTTITTNDGASLKVLDYKTAFGGMVQVETGGKTKWIRLSTLKGHKKQKTSEKESFKKGGTVKPDKASDAQRFAKPMGYRWKESAVDAGIIKKYQLSKTPSKRQRAKYPEHVDFEDRSSKSDKKPSRKYKSL